ncbi:MAG: hypothetical protein P8123_03955 [bacterium]|jgi:hypothetical protein
MAATLELKKTDAASAEHAGPSSDKRILSLIKTISIVTIVLGALPALDYIIRIAFLVRAIIGGMKPPPDMPLIMAYVGLSLVLPVAKIVGGCGMLGLRLWARKMTIMVFGVEYLIGITGAILFYLQSYRLQSLSSMSYDDAMAIGTLRMVPTYVFALISLLFIALLTRDSVKRAFS